jgi:hypothetical protein
LGKVKSDIESGSGKFWFALDNAAKIYPAVITKNVTNVFRITAILKEPVKIKPLLKAVLRAEKRFPYLCVQLKEGFFWYYLEHLPEHIPVEPDEHRLCREFLKGSLLIRIPVNNNSISIECSHILTDGTGALELLKTILGFYADECGHAVPRDYQSGHPVVILEEEYEDAYNRYFKAEIPPMVKRSKAFHLPFPLKKSSPRFERLNAFISLEQIKKVSNAKRGEHYCIPCRSLPVYIAGYF